MKSRIQAAVIILLAATIPGTSTATPPQAGASSAGEWVAGDLHIHTIWGHDTCITPSQAWDHTKPDFNARQPCEEPWTWGMSVAERISAAQERGLDYIAISDHNNVMSQRDPAWTGYTGPMTLIPAYENSLAGHAQMIGATSCYSIDGPIPSALVECDKQIPSEQRTTANMQTLGSSLRANGGAFQVNHPSDMDWANRFGTQVVPDTVEVWNIGAWAWQPPALASNDNDFSLSYWDRFLREGHRVGATGGSDSHWRLTHSNQGVGEPTTWVWTTDRSAASIIQAIRQGRTFISHEPPARRGTRLFLEADSDGDGTFESMVGDAVPAGSTFRVRAEDAVPLSILRVVTDTGTTEMPIGISPVEFETDALRYVRVEVRLPDAQEQRVDSCDLIIREMEEESDGEFKATHCRNRLVMQALTSPIYVTP